MYEVKWYAFDDVMILSEANLLEAIQQMGLPVYQQKIS